MKRFFIAITIFGACMIVFSACANRRAQPPLVRDVSIIVPDTFVMLDIPTSLTNPADRAEYLVMNYWNRFDFANESLIERPEITEQAFVNYIHILSYVADNLAKKSITHTLRKAQESRKMYIHFVSLFEKYLYSVTSPFRNHSLYVHVLQEVTRSRFLTEAEKSPFRIQLDMALRNRVGSRAANFSFTLPSGERGTLRGLRSQYTLLVFFDPACTISSAVIERLNNCDSINAALARNVPLRTMLTILTIYPHSDRDKWLAHVPTMPERWLHGHNENLEIVQRQLYNIRTSPTIYLLDRNKRVILKDATVEEVEAFFSF
jgi:hypothetical protein